MVIMVMVIIRRNEMTNTRQDYKILLRSLRIESEHILVNIPNGIAKMMRGQHKKSRKVDPVVYFSKVPSETLETVSCKSGFK